MGHQQLYWSHPRKFGQGSRSCRVCSNRHGLIRKYGLNMCRQCFRQYANDIGFVKASICVVLCILCKSLLTYVLYGNVSGKGIPASECRGQVVYQTGQLRCIRIDPFSTFTLQPYSKIDTIRPPHNQHIVCKKHT
ncbi:unnamed protein product [Oncorhynchus mykiss]|uniref:Small ribosomal subunit protein uS14 n=1 Tax=Oncorhynchus mykiss TaxID=8022 RepID=A0A060WKB8_ONCMY|nr:unnamed protein product [Oncorhynchus mykiss]